MDRRRLPLLAAPALLGCYGPADFQEESALTRCALYEECGYLSAIDAEDYEACLEILRSEAYACVEFQAQAARDCIEALEQLSCDDYSSGSFPMSCLDACTLADE